MNLQKIGKKSQKKPSLGTNLIFKKKNILCDAKAFCFGPISKLLIICELLKEKGHRITFLVSGTSKMLSANSFADRIIECDTEDREDLLKHEKEFKQADVFINIMNPVSAEFATARKIPLIQIDSLFWMWDDIPESILESKAYFIQNFEGVDLQLKKFSKKIKNPIIVGPIVKDSPKKIIRKNKILINLGGMESKLTKVGVNTQYPFVIMKILDKIFSKTTDIDEIVCAGNKDALALIKKTLPNSKIKFIFFNHDSFLAQLAEAKLLITSPGLTTAFEAFNTGTPTFFLPPQNFSQYWNLDTFKKEGVANGALNWNTLYSKANLIKNEKQSIGVEKVLECIKKFENDFNAWSKLEKYILKTINSDERKLNITSTLQKQYFDSLGGNGANKVADKINKLISNY